MVPYFVVAAVLLLVQLLSSTGVGFDGVSNAYDLKSKEMDMKVIGEAIESYYQEKGAVPADLQALASTPGYEYVAARLNGWQSYTKSGPLSDGTWSFYRVAAVAFDRSKGETPATYFSQNACGPNPFASEVGSWCGTLNSRWYVLDTRKYVKEQMTTERLKLVRLSMKFADYYNQKGTYPSVDGSNNSLANSSVTSIAALVGYTGNARNCTGQYQYLGIPIDCNDMFDLWGGKVGYQFETDQHVIFVSEPPIFNGSGDRVIVAVDRT